MINTFFEFSGMKLSAVRPVSNESIFTKMKKRIMNIKICMKKKEKVNEASKSAEANKKKEVREELTQLSQIFHNKSDLICPICLKYICNAVCCTCGHAFCEVCIQEYFLLASDCVVCGQKIRGKRFNTNCKNIDNIIESMLQTINDPEEMRDMLERKKELKKYVSDRKCQNLEVGQKIDVRSPEYVWCVGVIKRLIYKQETRSKSISIHYEGFPTEYNETVSEHSSRIARYRFYTGRRDIPTIKLNEQGEKVIMLRGKKIPYNFLSSSIPTDTANQLIDTDDEK